MFLDLIQIVVSYCYPTLQLISYAPTVHLCVSVTHVTLPRHCTLSHPNIDLLKDTPFVCVGHLSFLLLHLCQKAVNWLLSIIATYFPLSTPTPADCFSTWDRSIHCFSRLCLLTIFFLSLCIIIRRYSSFFPPSYLFFLAFVVFFI